MSTKCFLELLLRSNLCNEQEINEAMSRFENERKEALSDDDALDQLCNFLIATQAITKWQSDKLRMGRWKGFYFHDYLLLEQVGKDQTTASYKARDIRDGKNVVVVVTPSMLTARGQMEYRVDPYAE